MTTWYRTECNESDITPVEVASSTDRFITIAGQNRKTSKRSEYECYYPTWKEAWDSLMGRLQLSLRIAESQAKDDRRDIERLRRMAEENSK